MWKDIVGAVVKEIDYSDDHCIILKTDKGNFKGQVEADCCSNTWIENVETPAFGLPFTIKELDFKWLPDIDMPETMDDDKYGYGYIQYYGLKIIGERGDSIEIDFRNSSNGYYGGSLEWSCSNDQT